MLITTPSKDADDSKSNRIIIHIKPSLKCKYNNTIIILIEKNFHIKSRCFIDNFFGLSYNLKCVIFYIYKIERVGLEWQRLLIITV